MFYMADWCNYFGREKKAERRTQLVGLRGRDSGPNRWDSLRAEICPDYQVVDSNELDRSAWSLIERERVNNQLDWSDIGIFLYLCLSVSMSPGIKIRTSKPFKQVTWLPGYEPI